jgi:glycosyltransferase involved in cell wall biosynthesis
MRKKRILFCSEATFLNTGYATYTREILSYLYSTGKYELAEMASYGEKNDPRAKNIPWKFYGVIPNQHSSKEEIDQYHSHPTAQFGELMFEPVCLDFKPDIVCDIRDFWMLDFQERSPFRPFFKWCIMPTVDARPQARQWISTYQSADACLTYSEWAGEVLKQQSGGKINYIGISSPSAHSAYQPIKNKTQLRIDMGVDPDAKIIGTVMRNQRRKLYPDLFETFRILLDKVEDNSKYMLYCHTSYPDLGWDIPELLQQYGLSSKVLFTYICPQTNKPFVSLFRGAVTQSPFTNQFGATLSNVKNGVEYEDLSKIINLFDIYVQYANCEGFGLPQVEAAACGVPVMATDYSAMESVVRNLKGIPIKPKTLYKELETGCLRAVPDNDLAANKLLEFFNLTNAERNKMSQETREAFIEHYQWNKSGDAWANYFDSVDILPDNESWYSPPRIRQPEPKPQSLPPNLSFKQISNWLISSVLCEPKLLNSHMQARIIRDLMYGSSTSTTGGMYFNESSAAFDGKMARSQFDFNTAYDYMVALCNRRNFWEQKRIEAIKQ